MSGAGRLVFSTRERRRAREEQIRARRFEIRGYGAAAQWDQARTYLGARLLALRMVYYYGVDNVDIFDRKDLA